MKKNVEFALAARRGIAVVAGTVLAVGAAAAGAGVASAAPVTKTLSYTCAFPLIGNGQVSTDIAVTLPDAAVVGQPIEATDFSAAVSVPEETVNGFDLLGAATVEGSATVTAVVTDGAGSAQDVVIQDLPVPSTPIPESGALVVTAAGPVPAVTPDAAGDATIAVAETFTSKLTPKKADGSETALGTFDLTCTVDAGQDAVLGTVPVAEAAVAHRS
ncbi:hypothetical protein OOZ19_05025 [Saccharopolyspora sp. NFXS83]|uniref:DUF6801 domain-containing protein n=1 Tax=Saccharopolyspora sp. NFXS83 TaxID=2993560 RepID=UPI00224B82FB|nr:DUF6801 domain-containing protein [Saccharopolyspora sp. NFXS83]MCX2729591.1 hypothetical protein [Saccharopolyspora sp. NFXS83]